MLSQLSDTGASDVVVGHALLTRCHIDEAPALMLGPVAVHPDRQRKGAGSAAIQAGLEHARRMGENHVVVVGDPKYYRRFGFTRASEFGIALAYEVPDDEVMAMTLDPLDPLQSGVVRFADGFGM